MKNIMTHILNVLKQQLYSFYVCEWQNMKKQIKNYNVILINMNWQIINVVA